MRSLVLVSLLVAAPAALACGGDHAKAEGKSSCNMPATTASTAALPKDGTHTTLNISGMTCGACADKVHAALMGVEGVTGAQVDLAGNKVEVAYDSKKTGADKLISAVNALGHFTATLPAGS